MDHKRSHGCEKVLSFTRKIRVSQRNPEKLPRKKKWNQQGNHYPVWDSAPVRQSFEKSGRIGMFFHMDIMTAEEKGYVFLFNNSTDFKMHQTDF